MDQNELLTTAEAAEIKGWTDRHVTKMIRAGRLKAIKKGYIWLIRRGDLDDIQPAERGWGRPPKGSVVYKFLVDRIQRGERNETRGFRQRIKNFAYEVIEAVDQGELSGKQAATIWLHYLVRKGIDGIEIPDGLESTAPPSGGAESFI